MLRMPGEPEWNSVPGIPAVGIPHETHGTHCHVGVEPSLDTDVQLTAGLGVGIDDIVDLMHIDVTGDIHPITASVPTHVTLDLQRAPPGGQIAFDSHLKATFMKSQLSFDWQIFDVCYSSPVGTVCLLRDILQIPTSGSVVIAQDEGFDPLDIDLMGGGRAIKWKDPRNGDVFTVSHGVVDGVLYQRFEDDRSHTVNRMKLDAAQGKLVVETTTTSKHLPIPLRFAMTYQR